MQHQRGQSFSVSNDKQTPTEIENENTGVAVLPAQTANFSVSRATNKRPPRSKNQTTAVKVFPGQAATRERQTVQCPNPQTYFHATRRWSTFQHPKPQTNSHRDRKSSRRCPKTLKLRKCVGSVRCGICRSAILAQALDAPMCFKKFKTPNRSSNSHRKVATTSRYSSYTIKP